MKKEKDISVKVKRIYTLTIITMIISLISCIIGFMNTCSKPEETKENSYDISMMHQVGVQDVLDLFASKGTYILYIGHENCEVCLELLPTLQKAQIEKNYITQYLDITKIDFNNQIWLELVSKLDVKITSISEGNRVTDTFGNFLNIKGTTPCVIIIKDGKQKAGFFGNKDLTTFKDWLVENGV